MNNFTREYLSIEQIQSLQKQGTELHYTGWEENTGIQKLYEVRYVTVKNGTNVHDCRILNLVKISDDTYRCQTCKKIHNKKSFEELKKSSPAKFCHCGGTEKLMELHIPHPVSGWETKAIFLVCLYCGGKYMYYRFACETEDCNNYCDISEIYCIDCRKNMKKV